MKNKLKKKHQKDRLTMQGSSFLYVFASVHTGGYILYRFDFDQLSNDNNDKQQQQLLVSSDDIQSTPLSPCLSFSPRDLPRDFCSLVPLGEYFYFVGQEPDEFFRITKFVIENLNPHQQNPASLFLEPVKSHLNYPKSYPLVFAANDNLYVISRYYSFTSFDFEMYSPAHDSWTVLSPIPHGYHDDLNSFLVLGDTVFFTTSSDSDDSSVLSFHLINKSWNVLSISPSLDFIHYLRPAFHPPVVLIGQMLFGNLGFGSHLTVGASPHSKLTDDTKPMFMRPSLAPAPHFSRQLSALVSPFFGPSHCITALQTFAHDNVLSCVSYGFHTGSEDFVLVFTFFKIPGTVSTAPPPPPPEEEELMDDYASSLYCRQCPPQKESGTESYFDSEFMHRRLFKLPSRKLRGRLITCFTC